MTATTTEEWAVSVRKKWKARGLDKKRAGSPGFRRFALLEIAQHALNAGYVTGIGDDEAARLEYAESVIAPPKKAARAKSPAKS